MKRWGILFAILLVASLATPESTDAKTWYVKVDGTGDVPTIQAGADSAQDNDTVLVAAGTYTWSGQGTGNQYGMIHILRGSHDMVIKSESGPAVTILDGQSKGRIMFFQGETELTVEGFTFRGGLAPAFGSYVGAAFAAHLSSPVVRDCRFINNHADNQGGAYWYGGVGAPVVENCLFENNSANLGGAILFVNTPLPTTVRGCTFRNNIATDGGCIFGYNVPLQVEHTLMVGNTAVGRGGGVYITNTYPSLIMSTTIHGNNAPSGGGIFIGSDADLTVTSTIVSSNANNGIVVDPAGIGSFSCTNLYGNVGGDWVGSVAGNDGINGNFSADPWYCATTGALAFFLAGDSPCAPGNHPNGDPCTLIGAMMVGCGGVGVKEKTWGALKSMYGE